MMKLFDRDMTTDDGNAARGRHICVRYPQHSTGCPQHIHRLIMPDSRARAGHLLRTKPQVSYVSRRPDRTRCGKPRSSLTGYGAGRP